MQENEPPSSDRSAHKLPLKTSTPPLGTQPPLETFHAKIVLADEDLAYVGSANLLGSGDGTSLEAGVLVDGRAALQVARLVDGVLRVARRY